MGIRAPSQVHKMQHSMFGSERVRGSGGRHTIDGQWSHDSSNIQRNGFRPDKKSRMQMQIAGRTGPCYKRAKINIRAKSKEMGPLTIPKKIDRRGGAATDPQTERKLIESVDPVTSTFFNQRTVCVAVQV
jgi:hypothetical protein